MSQPTISLIVATVGRTVQLDRLFDSLEAQTFKSFEVIVVDQNDDDRLLPFLERARTLGIFIKHMKHHPANLSAARNAGIEAAVGEWVGFPDDDCWYDCLVLEKMADRFASNEAPAGAIARWMEQGEPSIVAKNLTLSRSRKFRDIEVSSITVFLRRSLLNKIGGFDCRFGVGQWFGAGEETDLILRALRSGALIVYESRAQVHHAVTELMTEANPKTLLATRHRERGTGAIYAKHSLPLWVIARGLVAPVLRPIIVGSFGAELSYGCAVMLGRIDGLLGWKRHQL